MPSIEQTIQDILHAPTWDTAAFAAPTTAQPQPTAKRARATGAVVPQTYAIANWRTRRARSCAVLSRFRASAVSRGASRSRTRCEPTPRHEFHRAARLGEAVTKLARVDQNRGEHDGVERATPHVIIRAGIQGALHVGSRRFVVGQLALGRGEQPQPWPVEREERQLVRTRVVPLRRLTEQTARLLQRGARLVRVPHRQVRRRRQPVQDRARLRVGGRRQTAGGDLEQLKRVIGCAVVLLHIGRRCDHRRHALLVVSCKIHRAPHMRAAVIS